MSENKAGQQINSQTLHALQQEILRPVAPSIIAIDLQTPANIGSIYRLADASAAKGITFVQKTITRYDQNKTVIRTSRNSNNRIPTDYCTHDEFEDRLRLLPNLIAIEITDKAENILNTTLPENCSFVIGSERYGIPDNILNKCSAAVRVPMYGLNGSMNVSHALAVCLYEWHRQHTNHN